MNNPTGLRTSKKAATRAALALSAAQLAREHGMQSVTANGIAARAGVSTRTFHNYFASKEAAILAYLESRVEVWIEFLRSRPRDEHIMCSLLSTALAIVRDVEWSIDEVVAGIALIEQSPVLSTQRLEVRCRSSRSFHEIIGERTGTDPDTDMLPALTTYAAMGAMRAAVEMHIRGKGEKSVDDLVRDAFAKMRFGFP